MSTSPPTTNPNAAVWRDVCDVRAYGKYVLLTKLAEGGMAEIFLGKQVGTQGFERDVVVKRMLKSLTSVPEFVSMFLDEARLAARLFHPHIVQIMDLGMADGQYYIGMEYLPGEDAASIIAACRARNEPIPVGVAARIVLAAAEGLHFAHSYEEEGKPLNVVHRDVTPSNILVTYQGTVKLVDFGIAKAETKVAKTSEGTVKGKWVYMSPEQAKGDPIDRRSDLFSLGLTFYELLTGVRVFHRDNELAILKALLTAAIPSPTRFRPDIPKPIEEVLRKALTRDREKRYQSGREMAADLAAFLSSDASAVGGAPLAEFMVHTFGRDRMQLKSQVPSLAALRELGVAVPDLSEAPLTPPPGGFPPPSIPAPDTREAVTSPPVKSTQPQTVAVKTMAGARRPVGLMAGLGVAVVATLVASGVALWALVGREPAAPAGLDASAALVLPGPADAALAPEAPDAAQAEPGPDAGPADGGPRAHVDPPRPVPLTPQAIATQVGRSRAKLLACFERHRSALASAEGQVSLVFTIQQSGTVSAARVASPGFEASPLSACIVAQIRTLRFPRHTDKEVTVNLPFVYKVTGQ